MTRARSFALALAALAGLTASGCDALVQASVGRQAATDLQLDDTPQEGECSGCAKFRAKPPAGINVPPKL